MGWAGTEFEAIDLGDERRNKRAIRLVERPSAQPTASVPQACGDWADTMAAYRFLAMKTSTGVRFWGRTRTAPRRAWLGTRWCCAFRTRPSRTSTASKRGMYAHPTYAVSTSREPLGVLNAWMWAREPKDKDGSLPGINESVRGVEGCERLAEMVAELPKTRLTPVDWLLRFKHNRTLSGGDKVWSGGG